MPPNSIAERRMRLFCSLASSSTTTAVPTPAQCTAACATTASEGGVSQEWKGGGDGSSHSRPWAPSQARLPIGVPCLMHFQMMYGKRNCESQNPNPPIDDTMFQSVNCTA